MKLITLLLCLALFGCSDPAAEKYQTAQFEEQQFNRPHAIELYREIEDKYPDSPYADKARERLSALGKNE